MPASQKRIGHFVLIIFVAVVSFLIPDLFSSCERFDYERVIIIETGSVTEIISNAAKITGQVIDLGEGKIVEHGHIWAKKSEKKELTTTLSTKTTLGSITARGDFTSKLTGLSPDTDYEVRAYATNSKGTVYGRTEYFKTLFSPNLAPEANFEADHTIIPVGEIVEFTDLSSNDPFSWEWDFGDGGTSMDQYPSHQYTMIGIYTVSLTVSNSYGSDTKIIQDYITVAALHSPPVADFMAAPTIISTGESVQFTDLSGNNPTSWNWDFGDGDSSTSQNPQHIYESAGIYSVSLMVSNPYGSDTLVEEDFITVNESIIITEIFTDERDNHEYTMVRIGEQVWMAENLAYLPEVYPPEDYSAENGLKYVYDHFNTNTDEAKSSFNYSTYGVLYNWTAAMGDDTGSIVDPSGVQGICPDGWHLPGDDEWFELILYVGDNWDDPFNTNAGGQLKEVGFAHWVIPNAGAADTYGFTGLPGGAYFSDDGGSFGYLGSEAYWWSSDADTVGYSWGLSGEDENIHWYYSDKSYGYNVRCIKDGGNPKKRLPGKVDYKPVMLKPGK